jgi:hypothetical protein
VPWFRVDDHLHDHRKARAAGPHALGLWLLAGSWCADNLTDGFVPEVMLSRWDRKWQPLAARLVTAGLWLSATEHGESGYRFHEWLEHQPSRERVLADRAAAADRQRKARDRAAAKRAAALSNVVEFGRHA